MTETIYQRCNECEVPMTFGFFAWFPEYKDGSHCCPSCAKGVRGTRTEVQFSFVNYRRQYERWHEQ